MIDNCNSLEMEFVLFKKWYLNTIRTSTRRNRLHNNLMRMVPLKYILGKYRETPIQKRPRKYTILSVIICKVMRRWRGISMTLTIKKIHIKTGKLLLFRRLLIFSRWLLLRRFLVLRRCFIFRRCLPVRIRGPHLLIMTKIFIPRYKRNPNLFPIKKNSS